MDLLPTFVWIFSMTLAFYYSSNRMLRFGYYSSIERNILEPNMINCFVLIVLAAPVSLE